MTQKDVDEFADAVVDAILLAINGPLVRGRMEAVESRLTALEEKPFVKFCGTWERGKTYEPGAAVVRDGGLWICKASTAGEPSRDFAGWQLAVKARTL